MCRRAETYPLYSWTAGTGVEWAFAPQWSSTLEYNYYDFGDYGAMLFDAVHNRGARLISLRDRINALTVGVNYHFMAGESLAAFPSAGQ
jgi:outer membrane immunogenic protein